MEVREVSRAQARQYVEKKHAELVRFGLEGGNVHQKSLDQRDELEKSLQGLTATEKEAFYSVYVEELNACTEHSLAEAEQVKGKAGDSDSGVELAVQLIALGIFAAIVIGVFIQMTR